MTPVWGWPGAWRMFTVCVMTVISDLVMTLTVARGRYKSLSNGREALKTKHIPPRAARADP